ncbi:MAG: FtsX-like permease family protein [Thermoflexales bacterium]|nr:FtsX-like permease family protein [Thermoflexales bacterium]
MLRPRWRKVLFDLWDNKARTLMVVASIAVGVFAIGVITGTYVIIQEDMNSSYAAVNPANVELISDPFDDSLVDTVRRMEGVAEAEGRRVVTVRVQLGADEWDTLDLVAIPDFADIRINQLLPRQGKPVAEERQVVLERKTLAKLNAAMGDMIEIELPGNTRRQIRVVGSVQELTGGYGGILGDLKGFIALNSLEWLEQPTNLNRLYITVAERPNDPAHIEQVAQQVTKHLEKSERLVYRTDLSKRDKHPLESILQALLGVLTILGVLIVFLSGSLITNTMSALLAQHTRHIGVMKLVGARRSQIIRMYMTLIVIFGLLALVVAVPLGSWGAFALSSFAADLINFVVRGFRVIPLAVLVQVLVAVAIPPVAGLLPVIRGSGVSVHEALHSASMGSEKSRKSWLDRQVVRLRWISRPLLISIRNTFRRKSRLALTLITLTLGGAIFIAVFNVQVALNVEADEMTRYFKADVNLDLARPYRIDQVKALALGVPGVEDVEVWTSTVAEIPGANANAVAKTIGIIAPPAGSRLITPVMLQGRWLRVGDENALTVNEAFWVDYPHLRAGDKLRLKVAGREDDWTVVGIFQYTGVDEMVAYASYDYVAAILKQPYHASAYRIVTTEHSLAYQQQVSTELEALFKEHGFRVSHVEAGNSLIASISNVLGILTAFLLIMAMLTAAVGCIGLAGTMSMNVMERTREIGVLRAIGGYDWFVIKLVLVEGILVGLISFGLGAVASFPITSLLSNTVSYAIFRSPADFAFTIQGFVVWLAIVLILSALASILPAYNASRLTIREVLAYE